MADRTLIEWTDTTWQIVTGCSVVSPGCTNCYAMKLAGTRLQHHPSRAGLTIDSKAGPVWNGQVRFNAEWLTQPLRWKRARRIFVAAHGDLFHEGVTDDQLDQIFAVIALACTRHTFQILTKRPERMRGYLADPAWAGRIAAQMLRFPEAFGDYVPSTLVGPLPNVWLGVSVEDQARADERIPVLLDTPAAVRWISAEPLLGPVDLTRIGQAADQVDGGHPGGDDEYDACVTWFNAVSGGIWAADRWPNGEIDEESVALGGLYRSLDWVVAGGESGPGARPMHPDWARQLRDQCAAAGVPYLFKQWGEWAPGENATNTIGRAVDTADWFDGRWDFERLTAASCEGMHIDDEPTLYRAGKKAAGRKLDGVQHDGFPEAPA